MASESVQRVKFGALGGTNLNHPYGAQGYTRSKVEKAATYPRLWMSSVPELELNTSPAQHTQVPLHKSKSFFSFT